MKREIIPLVVLHLLTVGTRSFAWCIPDVIISAWARATCLTQPVSILARVESGAPFCDWDWIFPQGLQGSFIPYPDYSLASVWSASPGEYWVEAWGRSCCGEWDYDTARVTVVEVESISSSRNSACVGGEIAFTVTTNPPGYGWLITWSGGGSPVGGSGSIFGTRWDNHGVKTVIATCGSSSKSKQVTIAAVTNFRLVVREFDPDTHALRFYYRWDSTSGNLEDLCGCSFGETVVYPNGNPYV